MLIGQLVSERYRVLERLEEGGLFVARDTLVERTVAVKSFDPADPNLVRSFLDEARVASEIGHPNIVESFDMGTTSDGSPFLVLELLEGTTIAKELESIETFSVGRACAIAMQIASALAAAHARGLVHRDLDPDNVFLVERDHRRDHVKVIDFGISKLATRDSLRVVAPEQVTNPGDVDARADVYALGAMLYEMLTGQPPLPDDGPDVQPIAELRSDIPPKLRAVIHRALRKDREQRYSHMVDLRVDLERFATERSLIPPREPEPKPPSLKPAPTELATPPPPPQPAPAMVEAPPPARVAAPAALVATAVDMSMPSKPPSFSDAPRPALAQAAPSTPQRGPVVIAAVAAVAVIAAVVATFVILRSGTPRTPTGAPTPSASSPVTSASIEPPPAPSATPSAESDASAPDVQTLTPEELPNATPPVTAAPPPAATPAEAAAIVPEASVDAESD
jgi:serine/threonine-protein kinase